MRTQTEILNEIIDLRNLISKIHSEHNSLDQMSMLGREGTELRKKINRIEGRIDALMWVLKQE